MVLEDCIVGDKASVRDVIAKMHRSKIPAIAIVGVGGQRLVGLFTNGDMRAYFLRGGDLQAPISTAMNPSPTYFRSVPEANQRKATAPLIVYPVVNADGDVQAMVYNDGKALLRNETLADVPLVIMAGGKGTRLYPYTKVLPKPLIPVDDVPIAERIIRQFSIHGCKDVWFVLNYKAEMIKAYFSTQDTGCDLHYLKEDAFLGTGGGLSLLNGKIDKTFIVSNCDIIIDDDLSCAYNTHVTHGDDITYVCALMDYSLPYGVIDTDENGAIIGMREKPSFTHLVSTGVYIIEPHVLDMIGDGEHVDFPDVAKRCMERGGRVGVFPVPEAAWIDMGEMAKFADASQRVREIDE